MDIINLSKDEIETIEERLDAFDEENIKYTLDGHISIGVKEDDYEEYFFLKRI